MIIFERLICRKRFGITHFVPKGKHALFSDTAEHLYFNASMEHRKEFDEVLERTNGSMHDFSGIPWDHLTLDECTM